MSNTELTCEERYIQVPFRSPKLIAGTTLIALITLGVGVFGGPTDSLGLLLGLVMAFTVIALSQFAVEQHHLLDTSEKELLLVTKLGKWTWSKRIESFDRFSAVMVNPKMNLWSRHQRWTNPISVRTPSGGEILLCNKCGVSDHDYAIRLASGLADIMDCDLLHGEAEMPLEVAPHGQIFIVRPKTEDTGILGRAVALSAVLGLVWGLISLMP